MAQHDNGRRPAGHQGEAWQQGHQGQPDQATGQHEQSSGGRYGGQQGGYRDTGSSGAGAHQNQYEQGRSQQGDNWRDTSAPRGGQRPGVDDRDGDWARNRSGQGSFGGQASDNDYGNRGVTESGNFGNYGDQDRGRGNVGRMTGQGGYARGGQGAYDDPGRYSAYDQGGQSSQRFGGGQGRYGHGYDARSDSTGGFGSSNFGPENDFGSGRHGGGDWNAGSYGSRALRDNGQRWHGGEGDSTYGQSAADRGTGYDAGHGLQGPGSQDRYGDGGYQGNWRSGQGGGQSYHDPDYHQWRSEQMRQLDRDYDEWRQHRYQRFSDEFNDWRSTRDRGAGAQGRATPSAGTGTAASASGSSKTEASDAGKSNEASSSSSGSSKGQSK